MIGLESYSFTFAFPRTETPEWGGKVERWYQLDAAAFALPETYWRYRNKLSARPAMIFLASPLASNHTDAQFVRTTAPSPAKFVHTLPNIRGASLLAVMEWAGEVYCLQKDPETVVTALSEGMHAVKATGQEAWVCSVTEGGDGNFTGHILRLTPEAQAGQIKIEEFSPENMANRAGNDMGLFHWLQDKSGPFQAADFELTS